MAWGTFFKPRPIACASAIGTGGMILGIIGTTLSSLKMYSYCSSAADSVSSTIDGGISIPVITAELPLVDDHKIPFKLTNLYTDIPENWVVMINQMMNQAPGNCFYLPFIFGLISTIVLSASVASMVMVVLHIHEQTKKPPEEYFLLAERESSERETMDSRV